MAGVATHQTAGPRVRVRPVASTAPRQMDGMLELQRLAGNRAVSRLVAGAHSGTMPPSPSVVQRGLLSDIAGAVGRAARWVGDRIGDALDIRSDEALLDYQEDRRDLREWVARGLRGPENLRAPTGIGGFQGTYDPRAQQLRIRLTGGVNFQNSITFSGGRAVVNHPKPGPLAQVVRRINRLPEGERRAAAAPYMWTSSERSQFLTRFNSGVASRWGGKYQFHATRENWTDLGASVNVGSAIHAGPKGAAENVSLTVYKTPPGGAGNIGVVRSGSGGATDNSMELNSPDALPRTDNLLQWSGDFATGSTSLDATRAADLNEIGATFRGGGPACRICGVTIRASTGGPTLTFNVEGATQITARQRYQRMLAVLMSGGNTDIALRTTFRYSGPGDGYRIVAGGGVAQTVAQHEAGHMFGLGDEYATGSGSRITGTGAEAGGAAKHDELARDMGLPGAVFENSDGIMSLGSVVRPQHYATFFWALGELTSIDWALGPPVPVRPPASTHPVGDFPTPPRDRATA
jgi:hypothetical protein